MIDWHSRYVLAWGLSNTLDAAFCVRAVKRAVKKYSAREIFKTATKAVSLPRQSLPGRCSPPV